MARLLVQESSGIREFELVDNEVKVGRELDNVLRLADPSISRHHAVIRRTEAGYEIQDLGSSNGVLLNGAKVQSSPLQDGDRVTLGQVQMTFSDPRPAAEPVAGEPVSPLGTVRINPEEMRRVQGAQGIPLAESASAPASAPVPPVQPRIPPQAQTTASAGKRSADAGALAKPADGSSENPAPGFLQGWLPPVPDDAEPIMDGDEPERGDFLTRLLAYLIDMAPIVAIIVIFMILGFVASMVSSLHPSLQIAFGCASTILQTVLCLGYSFFFLPWCWSKFGATPGKKMMKLRVVPEGDPYGRIDMGTAYLRLLGHICNCTIGYLLILMPERKAVQDYLSKSICIKVDR